MTIAVLEDESSTREVIVEYLRIEGYSVIEASRGDEALDLFRKERPDLAILDVNVDGPSGFLVARTLRRESDLPIIFLTSRDDETSRITGLELGADDYVIKPFSPRELVLRVAAVLRRAASAPVASLPPEGERPAVRYRCGTREMEIDIAAHRVTVDGAARDLTPAEWRLLVSLVTRAPAVMTREAIIEEVLGQNSIIETDSVKTHVANLRTKLGDPCWIATVRGFGYRFEGVT